MRPTLLQLVRSAYERSVLTKLDALLPAAHPSLARTFAIAIASVAVAALLRGALGSSVAEAQFVTFFSAVILTTLLSGVRGGLLAVLLSAVTWWIFFASPAAGPGLGHVIAVSLFVVMSGILVLAVGAMRIAFAEARDLQQSLETRVQQRTQELQLSQQKLQDLTSNLEKLVARRTQQLRDSRDLLRSVIDGMPDAVFLFEGGGDDLRFAYINSAAETFLGRGRDEVIGKRDKDIISLEHSSENRQVLSSNQPLRIEERLLQTPTGGRCVEVRKFPFSGSADQTALLTIIRDVTELRQLEDSLRQRQRIDALGQLTGGIAHDFNNLLAIAIGNIDLLEDTSPLDEDAKELVESARNACLRGAELTGRLLAFARKQTLQPVATDMNQLLADYTKLLARLLGADIDLRLKLADGLWHATADRAQLEAAITNLATNARDAMSKGGTLTISTRNEILETSYTGKHPGLESGEYVAIEVSDTGHGMTPEVQEKAVEPFFTTKAEGHGTGLGLSMVFGFAKQSGGHVRIYSEPGEGTTMTLLLPRAVTTRADETVEKAGPPEAAPGETVLVVDDNAGLRRVAVKQLSSLGYRVLEAHDGPSALRLLSDEAGVDLLLTDIVMPGGLSGVELGRQARQLRPELKLIYMSGFPEAAFGDRADLDPDVILLRKPFRKVELANRLREVLGTKEGR